MTRPSEIDWLYRGVGRFLPEQWERFRAVAGSDDVVHAYARLLKDPDRALRERAAAEWVAWEDAVISFESNGRPGAYSARVGRDRLAFVRICTHYFANDAWLQDGELLRNANVLTAIPGILIHGRLVLGSPLKTAWDLQQACREPSWSSSRTPATPAAMQLAPPCWKPRNGSSTERAPAPLRTRGHSRTLAQAGVQSFFGSQEARYLTNRDRGSFAQTLA